MKPIREVAATLGAAEKHLLPYGREALKIHVDALSEPRARTEPAKVVLVSAITPTKAGEGKTTTSIGLADGMARIGESVCLALREPSLGPCFGVKGGGTGGGKARLHPSDRINLHFTGDFHAITSAHNLLAAAIDNHVHFGREPRIEPRRVLWPRVMDMNDRVLRDVVVGLGGKANGHPRETSFDITAASELMAIICLASDAEDLRTRIDRTLIGFSIDNKPVYARDVGVTGAMMALLADVVHPNLVQSQEGTPAIVHGGPFANIAHGCNSLLATKMAMHHADWVVTEAGFGFDLGAEKFFDIKMRAAGLQTAAVVLVASIRALKMHGNAEDQSKPDPDAVLRGLPNLEKHIESIRGFGESPIIALNRFATDTEEEIQVVRHHAATHGVPIEVTDHFARGSEGSENLARAVVAHAKTKPFTPTYELSDPISDKIRKVALKIYGARDVAFTKQAERDLKRIVKLGYADLPVCIAKTQSSLSDDPKLQGRPRDFELTVREVQINAGAGFLVVLTGDILRMPGLPRVPAAEAIDLKDGEITGL